MKITNILDYQKLDTQLRQIEKQLGESPERIKSRQLSNFLRDSTDELKKMDARANELNFLVSNLTASFNEKSELLEEYENEVEKLIDRNELSYLGKKVAELAKALAATEREINAILSEIDDMTKKYETHRERVPAAKKQYVEYKTAFDEQVAARSDEVMAIRKQMSEVEAQLDPEVITRFKQLKAQNIYPPFVPLSGAARCGGCQMEMSGASVGRIDMRGFVECENCHRIIYKE